MKCPHCQVVIHDEFKAQLLGRDGVGNWIATTQNCPACKRLIVALGTAEVYGDGRNGQQIGSIRDAYLVRPKSATRPAPSPEVPVPLAEDYREACLVIEDSSKASAALSRRCLQHVLRDHAGVKHQDLSKEIQEVIDSRVLPSQIADALDAVRQIGNFAAHPIKSRSTGEVCQVEAGEAEWLLDVLESMFDFYFVQPALLKKKREALNKKLADAGKPPLKAAAGVTVTP